MNVLDLFSGIGGFSLGLERAGMRTVAFCEIEPFCQAVLRKHWPDVPVFGDVRELTAETLADARWPGVWPDGGHREERGAAAQDQGQGHQRQWLWDAAGCGGSNAIDVICGGFPCQDISVAGKGVGIDGERSGLWSEYARIVGEVRPRYVIVENVAALLGRGIERVLGGLAALGYDAEWHCIPASAIGAPHRRDRVWIIAYAGREQLEVRGPRGGNGRRSAVVEYGGATMADAKIDNQRPRLFPQGSSDYGWRQRFTNTDWWIAEPNVGRVAHGVPARVDRLRSLGNAIVPQIAEIIGRAIMRQQMSDGL